MAGSPTLPLPNLTVKCKLSGKKQIGAEAILPLVILKVGRELENLEKPMF